MAMGVETRPLPLMMILPRCYALFYEFLERATCDPRINDEQRRLAVRAAIDAKGLMLRRCPTKLVQEIEALMSKHCAKVRRLGRFAKAVMCARVLQKKNW